MAIEMKRTYTAKFKEEKPISTIMPTSDQAKYTVRQ
jgi:hypothetical protein